MRRCGATGNGPLSLENRQLASSKGCFLALTWRRMGMVKVRIDVNRFSDALDAFAKDSKKSWEQLFLGQIKMLGKQIIMVTPPMMANRLGKDTFATGKARGQAATASDILKVFISSRQIKIKDGRKAVSSLNEMQQIHQSQRNRRGRVGSKKRDIPASGGILKQYIKQKTKSVGYLASGWNALKTKSKATGVPKWITDKNAGGNVDIRADDIRLRFLAWNHAKFAGNLGEIRRYMQIAVDQQAINLWRQVGKRQSQLQARMTQATKSKRK